MPTSTPPPTPRTPEQRRQLLQAAKERISAAANLALKQPGAVNDLIAHSQAIATGTPCDNFTAQLFTELQQANAFLQAALLCE